MKLLIKELFRAIVIGFIIFIVLLFIAMASGKSFTWNSDLSINFLFVMLYSICLYTVNSLMFQFFDRKYGRGIITIKRFVLGVTSSLLVSLVIIFILRIFEDVVVEGYTMGRFLAEEKLSNYFVAFIITFIVDIGFHIFYVYKRYQENQVKKQKIIAGTASAQFETLKNQIDPHFLFNSLNVLSSLIEENPDNAQRFTTSLSKIYRYVLEQRDKEVVSVQEELSFAKTYMNLLKMRFENSLFYDAPTELVNPDSKVVPLSLQLLLENTIKHNVVSPQRPLHIKIYEKDGYLVVENTLQKKEVLQDRRGVGLQNIVKRYAILTNRKVEVEESGNYFKVYLPILTKQVAIMEQVYTEEENDYYRAQKRVEDIKGFYGNLMSYLIIIPGLGILNYVTSPEYYWFLYPAFGWGLGIVIHGLNVFNFMPFLGKDWEDKKIKEFIDKEKSNKWK